MTITELYSNVLSGIPSTATTVAMCLVGAILLTLVFGVMTYLLAYVIAIPALTGAEAQGRQRHNQHTGRDEPITLA